MINTVMCLGSVKYSKDIALVFANNDIRILEDNFLNVVDFLSRFESLEANVDVLVIADEFVKDIDKQKFFSRVRQIEPNLRIVILFPGYRNQYIEEQISDYKKLYGISDIIYEGTCLDVDYFADVIKKGYIYDYDINVFDEPEETAKPPTAKNTGITIGVMGLTRGCGVTSTVVKITEYLSKMNKGSVKAVDFSGTGNLRFAKSDNVTFIVHSNIDVDRIKKTSAVVVFDFGAPFELSSKGKLLSCNRYNEEYMKYFRECDVKIFMCFSDKWHIGKTRYIFNDKEFGKSVEGKVMLLVDSSSSVPEYLSRKISVHGRNDRTVLDKIADMCRMKTDIGKLFRETF